jgi:hypothetical protein
MCADGKYMHIKVEFKFRLHTQQHKKFPLTHVTFLTEVFVECINVYKM